MTPEEITVHLAAEQVSSEADASRQAMLRHPDCRWIAEQSNAGVDQLNVALARLLRLGLIGMSAEGSWRDRTGITYLNEREFRRVALARIPSARLPDGDEWRSCSAQSRAYRRAHWTHLKNLATCDYLHQGAVNYPHRIAEGCVT